jgi:two-component system phosphate regulon sensor histidine kinase PhoR
VRFRAPANVQLHRAQVILILGALLPTILTTLLGIILLATESSSVTLVTGILVLAFCASSLTGYILGSIFLQRGAQLARVQSDFLSAVSHELRTPMTSMRMFVEALQNDQLTDPEERAKCLNVLHREMGRLDVLVGRLIELSRIESGSKPFELVPIALLDVVDSAVAAVGAINLRVDGQMELNGQLEVDVEPGLRVVGDQSALTQVLVNLLSNAWKYTGDDKRITLKATAASDKEVEIVVSDNGPGIPAEEQKKIFEKFERGTAAVGVGGSGMGLAIVQAIIRAHHGRVELRSSPQRGSSFRVFIPRSKT